MKHLSQPNEDGYLRAACGSMDPPWKWTNKPDEVTCHKCLNKPFIIPIGEYDPELEARRAARHSGDDYGLEDPES